MAFPSWKPTARRPPADRPYAARRAAATLAIAALVLAGLAGVLAWQVYIAATGGLAPHPADSEWAFTMTGTRSLNHLGFTGKGIRICVLDTGIDPTHPDFAHLRLAAWKDFVNNRTSPYDDNGHGTAMAGLIAANGTIRGAAPDATLIVGKVLNATGSGTSHVVALGVHFCMDPYGTGQGGADIISLSLGSLADPFLTSETAIAVENATARGVVVVAAAGNDGGPYDDGDVEVPSNVTLAISVGAVDEAGRIASFSSMGAALNRTDPNKKPEIVAPGVSVVSTAPGGRYTIISGTSPATAIAAGLIALLLEADPALRPSGTTANLWALKTDLMHAAYAEPGQTLPHDPHYGYGLINDAESLALA